MFSKKPEAEPRAMAGGRNAPGSTFSMLAADLSVKGDIDASADLHIDGNVDGDITCASLVQGETSVIAGGIFAQSARLSGEVRGSITCGELVVLKSARIHGDVSYDSLTIEQGAIIDGRLSPRGADSGAMSSPKMAQDSLLLSSAAE